MWFWQAFPDPSAEESRSYISQDYEVTGYVIEGEAELHVDGKVITLTPGDSWVVPTGALHSYLILEPLTAIRTSHPPSSQVY
ncbi:cupin domain-containing protein [Leptolyngbya cf. ectocarpi LEGE 11479]|uniref:Cupin domain-containing protein n=2 Tax=Leptolyngbya ectocarpi TaxID=1202 RepID=A0A928ZVR1_LEPEC|nr:cupin domain-containing protein [Leptolyngbya cf. ectocarpi LEGE 11479]